MAQIGDLVQVIYPDYAAGYRGRIEAQEASGRWIVRLEENPLPEGDSPLYLSLEESEFEIAPPLNESEDL